jgi:hypothetical protein
MSMLKTKQKLLALDKISFFLRRLLSRDARFFLLQLTKTGKIYQITFKYTKKPKNMPGGHKIDQTAIKCTNILHRNKPPKFTQICIFGLKTNHLATQLLSRVAN